MIETTTLRDDPSYVIWRADALRALVEMPSDHVDTVITDPPYSSGGMFRGDRTQDTNIKYVSSGAVNVDRLGSFAGDTRDQRAYAYWSALWLSEALRVTKEGGLAMVFTDWRQLASTIDAFQAGGWLFRGVIPWVKPIARPQSGKFSAVCEYIVWGSKGAMPDAKPTAGAPAPRGWYEQSAPRAEDKQPPPMFGASGELLEVVL